MSLENLATPKIKVNINKEEWNVEFKIRNFAALKNVCDMSENELLQGLIQGDIRKIPFAIWASTLVFAPFDPIEPLKIERQIPLEDLFNLSMAELKEITDKVVLAMEAYLPKAPTPPEGSNGAAKKKQPTEKKKTPKTKSMK